MAGRPPKPRALHILEGTLQPYHGPDETALQPRLGVPDPPDFLGPLGREEWFRAACELDRMGILALADRAVLAEYCQAWERVSLAEQSLAEHREREAERHAKLKRPPPRTFGLLVEGHLGRRVNPILDVIETATKTMLNCARELGMTPSSRTKIRGTAHAGGPLTVSDASKIKRDGPAPDTAAKYFSN